MTRHSRTFSAPPRTLLRHRVHLDNLVLVPGSLLLFKDRWQALADSLPVGEALLIVPAAETPLKRTFRRLVPHLRTTGRHITVVPSEQLV